MFTVWVKGQRLDPILGIETMHNINQREFDDWSEAIAWADEQYEDPELAPGCSYVSITAPVGNEKNCVLYTRTVNIIKVRRIYNEQG